MSTNPPVLDPHYGEILERAIRIASQGHYGQRDKGGKPYILHPLRVMGTLDGLEDKIVAVLHDVLEDTTVTPDLLLQEGIPGYLVTDIRMVSRDVATETYDQYIARVIAQGSDRAIRVKLADVIDNSDIRRVVGVPEEFLGIHKRWLKTYRALVAEQQRRAETKL